MDKSFSMPTALRSSDGFGHLDGTNSVADRTVVEHCNHHNEKFIIQIQADWLRNDLALAFRLDVQLRRIRIIHLKATHKSDQICWGGRTDHTASEKTFCVDDCCALTATPSSADSKVPNIQRPYANRNLCYDGQQTYAHTRRIERRCFMINVTLCSRYGMEESIVEYGVGAVLSQ